MSQQGQRWGESWFPRGPAATLPEIWVSQLIAPSFSWHNSTDDWCICWQPTEPDSYLYYHGATNLFANLCVFFFFLRIIFLFLESDPMFQVMEQWTWVLRGGWSPSLFFYLHSYSPRLSHLIESVTCTIAVGSSSLLSDRFPHSASQLLPSQYSKICF